MNGLVVTKLNLLRVRINYYIFLKKVILFQHNLKLMGQMEK